MKLLALFTSICAFFFILPSSAQPPPNDWAEKTLRTLSLEQKVGQMLQIRVYAQDANINGREYLIARDMIQKYHIGSVDLGAHLQGPNLIKGTPRTVATILNQFQQDSELPLLVGADIERGVASRVANTPDFPLAMSFGATGDPNTAKELGRITAQEARAIGIHWAYAPVADVSENPDDQVIANRSFGLSPKSVGAFVSAFTKGAREGGLLVTAKHFPGQGVSSVDSHVGIVSLDGDLEHLGAGPPFPEVIIRIMPHPCRPGLVLGRQGGRESVLPREGLRPFVRARVLSIRTRSLRRTRFHWRGC